MSDRVKRYGKIFVLVLVALVVFVIGGLIVTWSSATPIKEAPAAPLSSPPPAESLMASIVDSEPLAAPMEAISMTPVSDSLSSSGEGGTASTVYFVSVTDGDNNNDGLSLADAFETIGKGLSEASSGDIVIVDDGIYSGNGNDWLNFGGKAINLKSRFGATNCIIDMNGR
ncbi:MAG: hypothetical protein GY869_02110, partial [Planctomycetes bacterium]|nr:hypothetical protein [Planctomycetota bacterium]